MNRPFATRFPEETGLGTLMPRMDRPEFERIWDETMLNRLRHDGRTPELAERQLNRLRQLDASYAAAKWEGLLDKLRHCD